MAGGTPPVTPGGIRLCVSSQEEEKEEEEQRRRHKKNGEAQEEQRRVGDSCLLRGLVTNKGVWMPIVVTNIGMWMPMKRAR